MSSDETAFCISCGSEIPPDTSFCPECGSDQDPESPEPEKQPDAGNGIDSAEHDGFTSWAIGFRPERTVRNILVGFAYFIFYYVGIPLLMYAYLRENPDKGKYFAWVGGGFLILMSFIAISQGSVWGIITGGISLLFGIFSLPTVRERLGVGGMPGIDVEKSARRSVIVGTGYAIGSMALIGSALPDAETNTSNAASTDWVGGSTDGGNNTSNPEFSVRIVYGGAWQGALSVTGGGSSQSESISGTGTQTIEITEDVDIISVNSQKEDDSSAELTVQILHNSDVVSKASTTAEYGVAQTSQSF